MSCLKSHTVSSGRRLKGKIEGNKRKGVRDEDSGFTRPGTDGMVGVKHRQTVGTEEDRETCRFEEGQNP